MALERGESVNLPSYAPAVFGSVDRALGRFLPGNSALRRSLAWVRACLPHRLRPGKIPRIIEAFARTYPSAFFIQVGSNDGVQKDPLRRCILNRRWSGIMIEPVPYVFRRLRQNYGHITRVKLENLAVGCQDGPLPFYYLASAANQPGLPEWYDGLGSFRKDVILSHRATIPDIDQRLVCESVPCLTFDSLCRKHGIEHVDIIQIDTEGYDFEVIKLIDIERLKPRLLLFEREHLGDERAACYAFLQERGFELIEEGMDAIALNQRDLSRRDRGLVRVWNDLKCDGTTPS